jgi:hypothetical protein
MGGIKQNPRLRNFMNDDTPRTNAQLLSSDCAYNCGHYFSLRAQKWVNGKCVESRENVAHGNDDVVVLADFARELERDARKYKDELARVIDRETELNIQARRLRAVGASLRDALAFECCKIGDVPREIDEWNSLISDLPNT